MRTRKKQKVPQEKLTKQQFEAKIKRLEKNLDNPELAWPQRRKIEHKLVPLKKELTHRLSGRQKKRITILSTPMGGKPR